MLRTTTDRFADEKIALSRSVADPAMFFTEIFCCGSVKDVRDATRTSRMDIRIIRTLTEELRMGYRRATDINYR